MRAENNPVVTESPAVVRLPTPRGGVVEAGLRRPTRIMALLGVSIPRDLDGQLRKLEALRSMADGPDIVGDLSIIRPPARHPLWRDLVDQGFIAGCLPIYTVRTKNDLIDPAELKERALEQMEGGVRLLTIHPTPTRSLVESASTRYTPWTSRGGGIVIRDALARDFRGDNVYMQILPDLVAAARRTGTVLSIGASFRSANIFDAMDPTQQQEINLQERLAAEIARAGVGVIIESPGHARPADIKRAAARLARAGFPVMPLGPIPTDTAIGMDHVSSAIGATLMGMEGAAHILAAVTREEHTGGIPDLPSTVEAVRAAKVAAHIIDMHLLGDVAADWAVVKDRVSYRTCVAGKVSRGCARCGITCPL